MEKAGPMMVFMHAGVILLQFGIDSYFGYQ
jgi:hypothetical protein